MAVAPSHEPVILEGPPLVEVKNIFFKSHKTLNYFSEEAQAEAINNDEAFKCFNRSLECSNKYGCLILSFDNSLFLIRVDDALYTETSTFDGIKKLRIVNNALPTTPNIIALSNGEGYLAVDTVRGDSSWLVIFSFEDFVKQAGSCRPLCEIRCSSIPSTRVGGVAWNPGDNMNNMVAINIEDGGLILAKYNGPNNVELNNLKDSNVRSMCWSPKGKQLVVGRSNGSLSQLKLDLTVAKNIPSPGTSFIPISILWTHTTQFLLVFQREDGIDFMQLDSVKGAPPTYHNSGDIFICDLYNEKSSCFFVPFTQWNTILAMTNSASDIVVLTKLLQNNMDIWTTADIADNRRAAFLLDNYARGVAFFHGSAKKISFSDVETYPPMPILFMLSQRGSLSIYSVVNSDANAASLQIQTTDSVPDSIFSQQPQQVKLEAVTQSLQSKSQGQGLSTPTQFQMGKSTSFSSGEQKPSLFQTAPPTSAMPPQTGQKVQSILQQQPMLAQQHSQQTLKPISDQQIPHQRQQPNASSFGQNEDDLNKQRQLGTSALPLDMTTLQKAVEEKRRGMTTQLQSSRAADVVKELDNDDQCAFILEEIHKFEERLANFKRTVFNSSNDISGLLRISTSTLEQSILTTLNSVEDFTTDMVSITNSQKEEVEVLKERILNHFSQLEYAKSLVERSRDPRYLEHLRSRPLDPDSQQKFEDICKLHNYVRNQLSECRRYFYEQNRKRDKPVDKTPTTQLIYLTLSNHSKIIRRLKVELDNIKERLGLGKHSGAYDEAEFLAVCEASYSGAKKESNNGRGDELDDITLNDLTSGISRVKLNRDSSRADKKPVQLSNRKLLILNKSMADVSVIKIKAEDSAWTRTPAKPTRPKPATVYHQHVPQAPAPVQTKASISNPMFNIPDSMNKTQSELPLSTVESTTVVSKSIGLNVSNTISPQTLPHLSQFGAFTNSGSAIPFSSTAKPNISLVTVPNKKTVEPIIPPPTTSTGSILKVSAAAAAQPGESQNILNISGNVKEVSTPTAHLPTLAGLLSTPPAYPSGSLGKSTPNVNASGLPTMNISFGNAFSSTGTAVTSRNLFSTEAFNAGFQKDAKANNVVPSPSSQQSTEPSVIEKPPTVASATVPRPIPKTGIEPNIAIASPNPIVESKMTVPVTVTSVVSAGTSEDNKSQSSTFSFSFGKTTIATTPLVSKPPTTTDIFSQPVASVAGSGSFNFSASPLNLSSEGSKVDTATTISGKNIFGKSTASTIDPSTPSEVPSSINTQSIETVTPTVKKETCSAESVAILPPTNSNSAATTTITTAESIGSTTATSSITSSGLFTSPPLITATTASSSSSFGSSTGSRPSLFGSTQPSTGTPNIFSSVPAVSTSVFSISPSQSQITTASNNGSMFTTSPGKTITTTSTASAPTGLFSSGIFSPPASDSSRAPTVGFMSNLSLSDTTSSKPPASAASGIFSNPFGASSASPAVSGSIFGGAGNSFSNQQPVTTAQTGFGETFGVAKTTAGGVFGTAAASPTSVFGSPPSIGSSSSPFGQSYAGTTSPFSGSVFGSSATSASQPTSGGFGASSAPAFGSNSFGSGGQTFGTPASTASSGAGLFSSTFNNPTPSTTTGSIFGGGFGGNNNPTGSGVFSSGANAGGGVGQHGFGFGQAAPVSPNAATGTTGSVFGGSPTSAPVFGGGATFGTTSPFGASFSSPQLGSTFGAGATVGANVFGGASTSQSVGFSSLAQQGQSPGFGSISGSGGTFGTSQPQTTGNLFGGAPSQPQQQNLGQNFSSWR